MIRATRAGAGTRRNGSMKNFAGSDRISVPGVCGISEGGS